MGVIKFRAKVQKEGEIYINIWLSWLYTKIKQTLAFKQTYLNQLSSDWAVWKTAITKIVFPSIL
jgi:RNAse (barnase) inhibitor barstar